MSNIASLKDLFLLDPAVTYLNHGLFGACPRPVFSTYQAWQARLERQPVEFLSRTSVELLAEARCRLARFLNVRPDEVVFFTSPTALILPVMEICQRARQAGLLSIIDGAHAPGQISLNLPSIGADLYAGACHKLLCAPKDSAL